MKELFTDPESFFDNVAMYGRPNRAMGVVALVSVAYTLQSLVLIPLLGEQFSSYSAGVIGDIFGNFIQPFVFWAVFIVGAWVVAKVLGGRPSIGRLVNTSAWAMVPLIGTGVAWAIGRYIALMDSQLPPAIDYPGFPRESAGLIALYLRPASGELSLLAFRGIGILFALLSFYLMVYAVQAVSDLDRRKAAAAVVPPALFFLAFALRVVVIYSPEAPPV